MKKISLLLVVFLSTPYIAYTQEQSITEQFSQDTTTNEQLTQELKSTKKPYIYQTHSIGISTRVGLAIRNNILGTSSIFLNTTTIDFYLGKRLGKTQYIPFLLSFRISTPLPKDYTTYFPVFEEFRWGVLFGASQYAFDSRSKENGIGWSMLVNGGLALDFPTIDRFSDFLASVAIIGIELELKAIYNFSKNSAFTFGTSLGYHVSYGLRTFDVPGDDGFADPTIPQGLYIDHNILWGITAGFLF